MPRRRRRRRARGARRAPRRGWKARARAAPKRDADPRRSSAARPTPACARRAGAGRRAAALEEADSQLPRLKADRERLGGVNLQADEDLTGLSEQFDGLDKEKSDVEAAIAKLRAGIGQINSEARSRLQTAFDTVNGHFRACSRRCSAAARRGSR